MHLQEKCNYVVIMKITSFINQIHIDFRCEKHLVQVVSQYQDLARQEASTLPLDRQDLLQHLLPVHQEQTLVKEVIIVIISKFSEILQNPWLLLTYLNSLYSFHCSSATTKLAANGSAARVFETTRRISKTTAASRRSTAPEWTCSATVATRARSIGQGTRGDSVTEGTDRKRGTAKATTGKCFRKRYCPGNIGIFQIWKWLWIRETKKCWTRSCYWGKIYSMLILQFPWLYYWIIPSSYTRLTFRFITFFPTYLLKTFPSTDLITCPIFNAIHSIKPNSPTGYPPTSYIDAVISLFPILQLKYEMHRCFWLWFVMIFSIKILSFFVLSIKIRFPIRF